MQPVSLHSNHLFHFKRDLNIVKLILQSGFQHRRWEETIPFFGLTQNNFMICFTDLKAQDSTYHRNCYGKNALVMTKEWARKNKISPVRYIHKDSVGMDEKYMHLKTLFRNAMKHANSSHKIVTYLATSEMYLDDKLPQGDITLANIFGEELVEEFEMSCKSKEEILRSSEPVYNSFFTMFIMIKKLHDELELRDAYLRTYIEDFTCPSSEEKVLGKVLYDEREWRSIKFPEKKEIDNDPNLKECIKQGYLPSQYNLTFSSDDVVALLVEKQEQKLEIIEFIKSNKTLLSLDILTRIMLFEEYDKDDLGPTPTTEFIGNIHKIKL